MTEILAVQSFVSSRTPISYKCILYYLLDKVLIVSLVSSIEFDVAAIDVVHLGLGKNVMGKQQLPHADSDSALAGGI